MDPPPEASASGEWWGDTTLDSDWIWGPGRESQPREAAGSEVDGRVEELKQQLRVAESRLQEEQERAVALAPYRVAAPKRGVIGNSRYAHELRRQIVQASRDPQRRPLLIFGEPGLEKDNLAALVHFGSRCHAAPFVRVDCERLDDSASELFGSGRKKGLLYYLPREGTLLLNNVQKTPKAVLPLLQRTVDTASRSSIDDDVDHGSPFPRIILTSVVPQPQLAELCTVIKVPPLRVRPKDIRPLQAFILQDIKRARNLPAGVHLTDDAIRQLESYSFPLNVVELRTMVERAATQSASSGQSMTEDVFWFAQQPKDQLRYNLLKIPMVRSFLRSSLWPDDINFGFTVYAFAALVILLFVGPQERAENFGLNLFWCWWWPASFIAFPFVGRVWCAVCPFMIYGELVQKWRLSQGAQLLKWPRELMEQYGPWFLFWLFGGILVWEEVWDLPDTAALSSWLLLLITFGAVVGSWFFERRIWCRYLCPIGGMNGLFAKLSMTELRARQGVCSSTCKTYHCYKGGPEEPPEGLETGGCPVYSHPAQLVDNRNCVLCMECLKACPHRSIEFRLRVPGVDLWTSHKPLAAEVALMMMLLGAVYLHDCDDVLMQLSLNPDPFLAAKLPHIATSAAFLAAPAAIAWGVDSIWRATLSPARSPAAALLPALAGGGAPGPDTAARMRSMLEAAADAGMESAGQPRPERKQLRPFVELAYGYLPLVWAGTLAYYLDNALEEAGLILPVTVATFGIRVPEWLPTFVVAPVVTEFLQGSTLLFGAALSLILTRKLGARPWRQLWPQCALICAFTAELWTLILPN